MNRFDVPTTQMPIFLVFVSAGVLFDGAFSVWVSLNNLKNQPEFHQLNLKVHCQAMDLTIKMIVILIEKEPKIFCLESILICEVLCLKKFFLLNHH